MIKKNILYSIIMAILLSALFVGYAQDKQNEKKENKMMMQNSDMQIYMDKIAADSTLRMQMMNKMMNNTEGDKTGMMQMCKMMMNNSQMHKMMMNMMKDGDMMKDGNNMKKCNMKDKMMKGNNMMNDSTKSMDKSEHEKHHPKDNN